MTEDKNHQRNTIFVSVYHFRAHLDNIEHSTFQFDNRLYICACVCAPRLKNENALKIHNEEEKDSSI